MDPVPSFRYGNFTIQVGAFRDQGNANRLKDRMVKGKREARIIPVAEKNGGFYRVQVGSYGDLVMAKAEMDRMRSGGFPDAFVVAVEGK
ncbi:MAG: SPOR domain-containing protein [Desulfobacteraceae bacterium]|nr:SPOR domain-containing protein [Desulfobacteraceae bacterium]